MTNGSRVGVVIVTHRSAGTLSACLASLAEHEPGVRVVIVDSGSPEGPPSVSAYPRTEVLVLPDNVGFGAACDAGAAALLTGDVDHVVCLNPDVRLMGPSLTELGRLLDERPEVGVATGPVVDRGGQRVPSAWGPTSAIRAAWFAAGWELPRVRRLVGRVAGGGALTSAATLARDDMVVDGHVIGGAMIVRRECWQQLGGFDDDFFLYWEDADLCHRARGLGWEVCVLPCTPIVHEAGTSSEGIADDQRWAWYLEGAETFARKHLTRRQAHRLLRALRWGRRLRR